MARFTFGGDASQFVGTFFPAVTLTGTEDWAVKRAPAGTTFQFYTTATGGSVSTDYLVDSDNDGTFDQAVTAITVREDGFWPDFQGPDTISRLYFDPDPADATVARVHIDAWDKTAGGASPASETVAGIAELATLTEATAGTDTARITTPAGVAAAINAHAAASNPHPDYALDTDLTSALATKANLVAGKVPIAELPVSTGATANTVAQRRSDGALAVATAVDPDEAVTKAQMDAAIAGVSGGGGDPQLGIIYVASSQAPVAVKAQAAFVCTGTNDQSEINSALLLASRLDDGLSGVSGGCVQLVGGDFFIGNNGTGAITMYPATWLRGSGLGTLIRPSWPTNVDRGAVELLNTTVSHCRVSDLTIMRPDNTAFNGTGIKFTQSGDGQTYNVATGNDPFIHIDNVLVGQANRYGVHLLGTNSGARETHLVHVHCFGPDLGGFRFESTDCKATSCTANAGNGPGFYTGSGVSGNTKLVNCKAYYCDQSGYELNGARGELVGCNAQDNGTWGFYVNSSDINLNACVADSNQRLDAGNTAGGFRLGGSGLYEGLHAFDRGQSANTQRRGIVWPSAPTNAYLTGRVTVPSGTDHVVGAPGANSYARVVRSGTSVLAVG